MMIKFILKFCGSNILEDVTEYGSFAVTSIDSLVGYKNKYYLQVC